MSTHIKILSQQDIQDFDAVAELSGEDRKKFFYISIWAKEILETLKTPVNKVGLLFSLDTSNQLIPKLRKKNKIC